MKRVILRMSVSLLVSFWGITTELSAAPPSTSLEIKNVIPVRQALRQATEIRIYSIQAAIPGAKPCAVLSERSHQAMFHLLKATNDFGDYGIKKFPELKLVVLAPGQPPQQYGYTSGRVGKWSTLGEMGMAPAAFQDWMVNLRKKCR